jgi:6-pyruvoyltetrahydropterin/6-carboxytetrahydropterin synthase
MFRLTREVRFSVNYRLSHDASDKPSNSYAGFPSLTGLGYYFALQVTLSGQLDPASHYLQNIKLVDTLVRQRAIPVVETAIRTGNFGGGGQLLVQLFDLLKDPWPRISLDRLGLNLSPLLSLSVYLREYPMIQLSQKFEFSASHRLHNPALSEEQNRQTFGKCSNPYGHGHNYEVQVTLRGQPNVQGALIDVPLFEQAVAETVINRFDHKNLNVEVAEFREVLPSVENISKVIFQLLRPRFTQLGVELASVTVWETPKTWCEYSGE